MGVVKKIKKDELSDKQIRQMEIVADIMNGVKDNMIEGEYLLVIGALATAISAIMAAALHYQDKDVAMEVISDLMNDIKKGTFMQIEILDRMGGGE